MLSHQEALERVLAKTSPLGSEVVSVSASLGRRVADALRAERALPPWDNSAMDGAAVRAADVPGALSIVATIAAGHAFDGEIGPGQCAKIMTGAPMPRGADTVVMREGIVEAGGLANISESVARGANVRTAGEDVAIGSVLVEAGTRIGAGELALLVSAGVTTLPVYRRPRVAILSTGDELLPPGCTPKAAQIVNSNNLSLAAQVQEAGGIAIDAGIIPDSLDATVRALHSLRDYDVLLTSGGVSVGDFDHVKPALAAVGIEQDFWKVAVKPGKPLAFGVRDNGQLVFGLPGNPASSLVSFELFVRPALRKQSGATQAHNPRLRARLEGKVRKDAGRAHFLRSRCELRDGQLWAVPLSKQGSGMLRSMVGFNALVEIPAELTEVAEGAEVEVVMCSPLGEA